MKDYIIGVVHCNNSPGLFNKQYLMNPIILKIVGERAPGYAME